MKKGGNISDLPDYTQEENQAAQSYESTSSSTSDSTQCDQINNVQLLCKNYINNKKFQLYKTEICRSHSEIGYCKYGKKCQFAHESAELRLLPRHPRYKTETCRTFWNDGSCPYGMRCCFIHIKNASLNYIKPIMTSRNLIKDLSSPTIDFTKVFKNEQFNDDDLFSPLRVSIEKQTHKKQDKKWVFKPTLTRAEYEYIHSLFIEDPQVFKKTNHSFMWTEKPLFYVNLTKK